MSLEQHEGSSEKTVEKEALANEEPTQSQVVEIEVPEIEHLSQKGSDSSSLSFTNDVSIWPIRVLYLAYAFILITSLSTSFARYSTLSYTPFVTSAFKHHSELATAGVISRISAIITYPIMAKCADFFGRDGGFGIAFVITTVSYIMMASCQSINTYLAAGIFSNNIAYIIMVQIFISDTSSFANRGFLLSLPEAVSSVPALYLGSIISQHMLDQSPQGWRWGYGMWAIIIPFTAIPLLTLVIIMKKRVNRPSGIHIPSASIVRGVDKHENIFCKIYHVLWVELDLPGAILLIAALSLILIPITLNSVALNNPRHNGEFIGTFVSGFAVLGAFLLWELRFAKKPFIPFYSICYWSVAAALAMNAFDFMAHQTFDTLFPSFMLVAGHARPQDATRIDSSLIVAYEISSVFIGIFMRLFRRSKQCVFIGVPLVVLGQGLMVYFVNIPGERVASQAHLTLAYVLFGIGRGLYQTSAQVVVQSIVSQDKMAIATAVFYSAKSLGAAIGVAIGGGYWNHYLPVNLHRYLPDAAKSQAQNIFHSITVARATKGAVRAGVDKAYRETFQQMAIMSTCIVSCLVILMFVISNVKLETRKESEERIQREEAGHDPVELLPEQDCESSKAEEKAL